MLELAINDNPRFVLDQREILREGTSFTVDTLSAIRAELGGKRPLCLLMGADAFAGLASWHRWNKLYELAHIVVALRPGFDLGYLQSPLNEEFAKLRAKSPLAALNKPRGAIIVLEITPVNISASIIREKLAGGKSVHDLLPPLVLDYIQKEGLYMGADETR